MSLSRILCATGKAPACISCIQPMRMTSDLSGGNDKKFVKPEDVKYGFFKKIYYRFKGIPLQGEIRRPRAFLEDIDKEFFAPETLPEMSRDFKEYPERDVKNFPYPTRRMYPPKARCLMFPDSWFTPFYNITGVSGPYLFFGGLWLFLINKEIFVINEEAMIFVNWILVYLLASRAFGYRLDKWAYERFQKDMDRYREYIKEDLSSAKAFREASKAETASLMAIKENFPVALKEAMEMQLEAAYRGNIEKTTAEMKRRLDYLSETETLQKRFRREFMVNWIMESVKKEIEQNTNNIKDKYLDNCIEDLNALAPSV